MYLDLIILSEDVDDPVGLYVGRLLRHVTRLTVERFHAATS